MTPEKMTYRKYDAEKDDVRIRCRTSFSYGTVIFFSCRVIGVKRNAEHYMFCFPCPWMRSGPESRNPGSISVTLSPSLTFLATFTKYALLGPEVHSGSILRHSGPKVTFPYKSALSGPKSHFGPKGVKSHQ